MVNCDKNILYVDLYLFLLLISDSNFNLNNVTRLFYKNLLTFKNLFITYLIYT